MQQLGRGMRKSEGKDHLMVFDFVDNANLFNMPYSMHRLLNLSEYHPGGLVLGKKESIRWDHEMFAKGEKPEVLIDYPVHVTDMEHVDLFNWQEQAKALLENNEEYTCAACRAGESFASEEHGVRPLMRWLNEGTDLSGASAADRIVGKAAAFLYVLLGVRTVYAPLMSVPARETLCAHGIEAIADAVVPAIRNRTDTGFCPMESAVWDISDPHEAKAALERKISEMMAKK